MSKKKEKRKAEKMHEKIKLVFKRGKNEHSFLDVSKNAIAYIKTKKVPKEGSLKISFHGFEIKQSIMKNGKIYVHIEDVRSAVGEAIWSEKVLLVSEVHVDVEYECSKCSLRNLFRRLKKDEPKAYVKVDEKNKISKLIPP